MSLLLSHSDPTMHIFTILEKNKQSITMKDFQTMMEQMDRWDIIDDTVEIFGMYYLKSINILLAIL